MTDKPIIFSAPMVRALLDGRKTQTMRRLDGWCEDAPALVDDGVISAFDENDQQYRWPRTHAVGDRLWVREAWRTVPEYDELPPRDVPYGAARTTMADTGLTFPNRFWGKLRQSMFMPRWASRLTLIVTDVKVERLQDISEDDAIAEGIKDVTSEVAPGDKSLRFWKRYRDGGWNSYVDNPIGSYASLWTEINGPSSWEANPWVAAYTFRVIKGNIDQIGEAS